VAPPASFPVDGLQALRAAYVAKDRGVFDRYHRAAFHATWREGKDIAQKQVVGGILAEVLGGGVTTEDAITAFSTDDVKNRLREETNAAIARGVFGVPSFFVRDELFWGIDRLDFVKRALAAEPVVSP